MIAAEVKPYERLAAEDIERATLEAAALKIEALAGNPTYRQAWRIAARVVRSMKP